MSAIDDAINNLSSEELDLLNSDPKMLSDFKEKYSKPNAWTDPNDTSLAARDRRYDDVNSAIADGASMGFKAALPSDNFDKPITPTGDLSTFGGTALGALDAAGQTLRDPTRISPTISQPGQVAGDQVTEALGGGLGAKVAGLATSTLLDPQTYLGGGEAPKAIEQGAETIARPGLLQKVFNLFKKTTPPEVLEDSVQSVKDMVDGAVADFGKKLNKAKADIGLPISVEDKEKSLLQYGNKYLMTPTDMTEASKWLNAPKGTADELATTIAKFKQSAPNLPANLRAKIATYLQDAVDYGNQTDGLLKAQYGDLGKIINNSTEELGTAKAQMHDVLENVKGLQKKLETPGAAQAFLQRIYKSPTGKNLDYLNQIKELEKMTGKETISDLFEKFGSQEVADINPFHPLSQGLIKEGLEELGKSGPALKRAATKSLGPIGSIMNMHNNRAELQSLRDRLQRQEIKFKDSHYAD